MPGVKRPKALLVLLEIEFDIAERPVSMFFDQYISDVFAVGVWVVIVLAVNEGHYIGVLLDGSRLPQVG